MKRIIVLSILVFILISCATAGSPAWVSSRIGDTEKEAKVNNEKMMNLNIGMSKEEVLKIMGNPSKREQYQITKDKILEFLFYRTAGWSVNRTSSGWGWDISASGDRDEQFTPLTFENNKLVGWGRNYYENVIKHAVEIKIK